MTDTSSHATHREALLARLAVVRGQLESDAVRGPDAARALRRDARAAGAQDIALLADVAIARYRAAHGDVVNAIAQLNRARRAAVDLHDHAVELDVLLALGVAWAMLGDSPRARSIFMLGVRFSQSVNNPRSEAAHQASYGFSWGEQGQASQYVEATLPALAIMRELGDTTRLAQILVNLAGGLLRLDRRDEAREALEEADVIEQAHPNCMLRAFIVSGFGELRAHEGSVDEGLAEIEHSRRLMYECGRPYDAIRRSALVIDVLHRNDRHREALAEAQRALAQIGELPFSSLRAQMMESAAACHAALGEHAEAYAALRSAVEARNAIADQSGRDEAGMVDELDRAWSASDASAERRGGQRALVASHRALSAALAREQKLRAVVEAQSITDGLTHVRNLRGFELYADVVAATCRDHDWPLTALVLDIDFFKRVNDSYGHATGDTVLREVAQRCAAQLREGDLIARIGGEEFAVLLPHASSAEAEHVARRLCEVVRATPILAAGDEIVLTISVGGATTINVESVDALVAHADAAMYDAKRAGRDRAVMSTTDVS